MAADWIKMRGNLWDDPRVARLCDLCDCSEAAVIGGLYWMWATADQHTEDGLMPGLTLRQINRKTGIKNFGEALCEVGFITSGDRGLIVTLSDDLGLIFIRGVDRPRPFSSLWQRLRLAVFARDGYACVYCGASGVKLECDHVTPVALGG